MAFNATYVKEILQSKEGYLKPVAVCLIKAGYVKLGKELSYDLAVVCDDVIMLKPF